MLTTTIRGTFPKHVAFGVPFSVVTKSTGPVEAVTVLLSDGVSSAWRGMTPAGLFDIAIVELIPQRVGTWRLSAFVVDENDCEGDRTGLARIVVVDP